MSDVASIGFRVDTSGIDRAIQRLGALERRARQVSQAMGHAAGGTNNLNQSMNRARRSTVLFGGSLNTVIGLFSVYAVARFSHEIIGLADSYSRAIRLLGQYSDSQEEANRQFERLYDIAQKNRQDLEGTVRIFQRFKIATSELNISSVTLETALTGLQEVIVLSGVNAKEASNSMIQLAQGMASGQLQGEELRSVLEGMPVLAKEIARQAGVPFGELREAASEGRVGVEAVIKALLVLEKQLDLEDEILTVGEAWTQVRNSFERSVGLAAKSAGETDTFAQSLQKLATAMEDDEFIEAMANIISFFRWIADNGADVATELIGIGAALTNNLADSLEMFEDAWRTFWLSELGRSVELGFDEAQRIAEDALAAITGDLPIYTIYATPPIDPGDPRGRAPGQKPRLPDFGPTKEQQEQAADRLEIIQEINAELEAAKALQEAALTGGQDLYDLEYDRQQVLKEIRDLALDEANFSQAELDMLEERLMLTAQIKRETENIIDILEAELELQEEIADIQAQRAYQADRIAAIRDYATDRELADMERQFELEEKITEMRREGYNEEQLERYRREAEALNVLISEEERLIQAREEQAAVIEELGDIGQTFFDDMIEGTLSWEQALLKLISRIIELIIQMEMLKAIGQSETGFFDALGGIGGAIGGLFGFGGGSYGGGITSGTATRTSVPGGIGGFADGGVFGPGGLYAFANGGVVNRPTIFPFANGTGLMGEDGEEAIMPLRKGPDGKLGVAGVAAAPNVNVNIINQSDSDVTAERQEDGSIEILVAKAINEDLRRGGPIYQGFRNRFDANTKLAKR